MGTSPKPGEKVEKGSPVDVLMSLGMRPVSYRMPELRGMRVRDARQLLEEIGLDVHVREVPGTTGDEIVSQVPFPGNYVETGDTAEVIVGAGFD